MKLETAGSLLRRQATEGGAWGIQNSAAETCRIVRNSCFIRINSTEMLEKIYCQYDKLEPICKEFLKYIKITSLSLISWTSLIKINIS